MFYFQKVPNEQSREVSPEDGEAQTLDAGRPGT